MSSFFHESPFKGFQAPECIQPFSDTVYTVPGVIADVLDRPMDQAVYLVASLIAIICSFIVKEIKHESTKRAFSIVTGMSISFFVFGIAALASVC